MYLSNIVCRYMFVVICAIILVLTTVLADRAAESSGVKQVVKQEGNKAVAVPSTSDPQPEMTSENDKFIIEKLKKMFNVTLVGTVISDTGKPVAIIEDNRSKVQKFYRLGDMIKGGRITGIYKDRFMLIKNGVEIELKLNSGTSHDKMGYIAGEDDNHLEAATVGQISKTAEVEVFDSGFPKIQRAILDSIIHAENFTIPVTILDDGRFLVDDVQPDSVLSKLGFRSGDVVAFGVLIQDKGVSSSKAFAQGLQQRFGENILRMEVEHDGKMEMLYIEIEDSSGGQEPSETQAE